MENQLTNEVLSELIENTNLNIVLHAIGEEDEQSLAIFLLSLSPKHSARILARLKSEKQREVAKAIAATETAPAQEVEQILEEFKNKIQEATSHVTTFGDGAENLGKLLAQMDIESRSAILESLEDEKPDVAQRVKEKMLRFDDILLLTDTSIQTLLRMLDRNVLALALRGASDEAREKIFENISPDEILQIRTQMESDEYVSTMIVNQAQQSILSAMQQLERRGMILMEKPRGG